MLKVLPVKNLVDSMEIKLEKRNLSVEKVRHMVEQGRVMMINEGVTMEKVLETFGFTKTTAPIMLLQELYKLSLSIKKELFKHITPDDKAEFIRNSDFETYLKAVDSGDTLTQLQYSKVLRADSQMNMNTPTPSLVINLSAIKDLLEPIPAPDPLPIIEAEVIEPEMPITPVPDAPDLKNVKIERDSE